MASYTVRNQFAYTDVTKFLPRPRPWSFGLV